MLVWKNASGEIRKRRSPSCSLSCGPPDSSVVSPPWVLSPRPAVCVQNRPSASIRVDQRVRVELAGRRDEPHLQLAGATALAHDEVAQEALLRAAVPGAEALAAHLGQRLLAHRVGALGGELAVVHGDDLVPAAGGVEAAHQLAALAGAERVLELVAVAPLLDRGHDRLELVALEPPDPRQRVLDLLLLDLELARVGQHLPRRAGVVGDGRDAVGRRLEQLDRARLGVPSGLADLRADAVAGHGAGDEDDVAVLAARDAVAAVGEAVDGELEDVPAAGTVDGVGKRPPLPGWQAPVSRACARCSAGPTCGSRCGARSRGPCAARRAEVVEPLADLGGGEVVVAADREVEPMPVARRARSTSRTIRVGVPVTTASSCAIRSSVCARPRSNSAATSAGRVVARHAPALDRVVDGLLHAVAREDHDLARVEVGASCSRRPRIVGSAPPRGRAVSALLAARLACLWHGRRTLSTSSSSKAFCAWRRFSA